MSTEPVLVEDDARGFTRITLNRPHQRNAMNHAARAALLDALADCRDRTPVILLCGNGPAFCAGIDLKEDSDIDTEWPAVMSAIRAHPAVVIAAARGYALGGGSTLIHASDLAVVAEDIQIGMPEIGFGLYPTLAGPAAQLRLPPKRAAWMVLTGQRVNGTDAAAWGMVNQAVPADRLDDTGTALAERVAGYDPTALRWAKKALATVPAQISEWDAAIRYGVEVGQVIKSQSAGFSEGLDTFRSGQRNPGQGS